MQDGTQPSTEIYAGLEEAAEAIGWTASAVTFDPADLSTLTSGLLQALSSGADYVVESGFPESQLSESTVSKFEDAGVPIVVVGTTPVPQTPTLLGDPGDQNARVWQGEALANWFVSDSQGKGRAVVVNLTTYPTLTLLTDTFKATVEKNCPGCATETLELTIGDALNGTLATRVISTLRADRDIKYVLFDNSGEIAGIDPQLQTAGLDDVKMIGSGIDPVTVESLNSGNAEAFAAFNFRYSGWASIDVAARHAVGDPVSDGESLQPSQLITREDVGELDEDAIFREPADGLEQFKALWLVSGS